MSAVYREYNNVVNQIISKDDKLILSNPIQYPIWLNNFIISYDYPGNLSPSWMARHFHKEELIILPKSFIEDVCTNPTLYHQFKTSPNIPFYAKIIENDSINKVTFELHPTNYESLPFYIRPFASKMERYSSNSIVSEQYTTIKLQEKLFILVLKNPFIDNRVKNIKIE